MIGVISAIAGTAAREGDADGLGLTDEAGCKGEGEGEAELIIPTDGEADGEIEDTPAEGEALPAIDGLALGDTEAEGLCEGLIEGETDEEGL